MDLNRCEAEQSLSALSTGDSRKPSDLQTLPDSAAGAGD